MVMDAAGFPGPPSRRLEAVFRADASAAIGTGHVHRCLGVADELKARGHGITFVCRSEPGHLVDLIRDRGFDCVVLPAGIGPEEDARRTVAVIEVKGAPVDWIVVDHYSLDAGWEKIVGRATRRLFVVDDLADRPHDSDVLLDASHGEDATTRYDGLVPARTKLLLGPRYIPLRREFFGRPQVPRGPRPVRRILMTFGGNDPLDMTGRALRALDHPDFSAIALDVTVGTSNPRLEEVRRQAQAMPQATLHVQHPQPSILMDAADLCLGAGGTTSWERCYLGLPSLIVVLADNQREIAERLDRMGVVRSLGDGNRLTVEDLRAAVQSAMGDQAWQLASSRAGQALVDGGGIARMVRVIEEMGG
jgi:UDP-2,4-diacetamido-2,4,6-trideoxy-beta-L-altropyranose hydrolase